MFKLRGRRKQKAAGTKVAKIPTRRRFLKGGGLAGVGAALGFPQVSRAQTVTLKMQTSWSSTNIFQEMAQDYVERVEAVAGGRLKIDLLSVGAVVKSFRLQEAVHKGVLDAAHTVTAYWYGKNKAASLFGNAPVFGANAPQTLAWIQRGGGKELYRELVQDILGLNLVGFFAFPYPTQPLGWFKGEIESADQLKGLKYRTAGLAADVMQGMGLEVVQLPGSGIIPAYERGVIDAFEYHSPTSDREFGAQTVSKHYMMGSYHQAVEFFEIIFNKDKFESLPKEHQAALEYGAEAASTANYALAMDRYSEDLEALITKDGVNVYRTPQSVMDEQLKAWDQVLAQLMKDPFFKKVVDSQKAWARRVAFFDLLNSADYKLAYKHYFPGRIIF
ncbi:TRAP transporter substrate-binding protein [Gammaproteobacteria bacterium]|nr:TRAP transporter substrate-binding protein [Gammaproteobacteria bacterium]